ncbi:MAG: hypothetical protein NVS2B7_30430 [Herpetosiphon sp.]
MQYYLLPRQTHYLPRCSQLDLVDVLAYLAQQGKPTFELRRSILSRYTRGPADHSWTARFFSTMRTWAEDQHLIVLRSERYDGQGRVYTYTLDPGHNPLQKPAGYVERGWIRVLEGLHVRWLLNFLLDLPARMWAEQKIMSHFANVVKSRTAYGTSLRAHQIKEAIDLLIAHRLIARHQDHLDLRLLRSRLQETPQQAVPVAPLTITHRESTDVHLKGRQVPVANTGILMFAPELHLEEQRLISVRLVCRSHLKGNADSITCKLTLFTQPTAYPIWNATVMLATIGGPWDLTREFTGMHIDINLFRFQLHAQAEPFAGTARLHCVLEIGVVPTT